MDIVSIVLLLVFGCIAALILIAGILMIKGSFALHKKQKMLYEVCTSQVPGVITEKTVETSMDDNGTSYTYYFDISFCIDGVSYEKKRCNFAYDYRNMEKGEAVTVFYDPVNPAQYYYAEQAKAARVSSTIIGTIIIGLALMFLSGIVYGLVTMIL